MTRYYFAYGSNLLLDQMRERCPESKAVAAVSATGWRLAFFGLSTKRWGAGGVASLVKDSTASVPGALYLLTPEDELAMDGFEGVEQGKYFKDEGFAEHIAYPELAKADVIYAYIMLNHDIPNLPSKKYLDTIHVGYRDWKLPLG